MTLLCKDCKQSLAIGHSCKPYILGGTSNMNVEQHLNVKKVAVREVQKLLDIARYQGQWTSTKSLQHQAISLGGSPDYMLRQFEVAVKRIENKLNELEALNADNGEQVT